MIARLWVGSLRVCLLVLLTSAVRQTYAGCWPLAVLDWLFTLVCGFLVLAGLEEIRYRESQDA